MKNCNNIFSKNCYGCANRYIHALMTNVVHYYLTSWFANKYKFL